MLAREEQFQLDVWTPLDYKSVLPTRYKSGYDWMAPTWVGEHRRRLTAYKALLAYRDNASRLLLRAIQPDERESRDQRREYGDVKVFEDTIRSAVLGDQQTISVAQADKFDKDNPGADLEAKAAVAVQDRLRDWAEKDRFQTKLVETERNAVSLGDGVYTLGWSAKRSRPVLRVWDPGFYFPVLDIEEDEGEFPSRVHLAWELPPDGDSSKIKVRRITYDLRDVEPYSVPWSDVPVTESCFLTDAIFTVDSDLRSPDDFNLAKAQPMMDRATGEPIIDVNLEIDFVPVIHIENTPAGTAHYGQASILHGLQIFDDIQSTDSDIKASAALTGGPMLALSGDGVESEVEVGPNKAIKLGANGSATVISGAAGLGGLETLRDNLLRRASVNLRVPEPAVGRVDASKVQAGIVLKLLFGPMSSLVDEMRLPRDDKYPLVYKFVQRMFQKDDLAKGITPTPIQKASLVFGSYLPTDQAGVVELVVKLLTAKAISLATALLVLQEVGVPVDDIAEEIRKIDERDYSGAVELLDASGNEQAVEDKLGVKVDRPEPPPPGSGFGQPPVNVPPNVPGNENPASSGSQPPQSSPPPNTGK